MLILPAQSSKWHNASRKSPCPICEKPDWCSIADDGKKAACRRQSRHHLFGEGRQSTDKAGQVIYLFNLNGEDHSNGHTNGHTNGHHSQNGTAKDDWATKAEQYADRLTQDRRGRLADVLGVPVKSLDALPVGYGDDHGGEFFTFPEVDGTEYPVGITRRYCDSGDKKAMKGARRGLTVPVGWRARTEGPVLVPEGASCTLALWAAGRCAIGRPSCTGGVEYLAQLLATVPTDRQIVIIGENDRKADGQWPGRDGARQTAAQLSKLLNRQVAVAMVPEGFKDAREWLLKHVADPSGWKDAGAALVAALRYEAEPETTKAETLCGFRWDPTPSSQFFIADYRPDWLVKGIVVRGQPLVCGAGQKGMKTTLMLDFGISVASATPWLGTFPVPNRRRVAILSGESGPFTLQETARRICAAKGIDPAGLGDWLHWQFRLPQLAVDVQLAALRDGLQRDRIEVAIVDPLYLSLLSGSDVRAENMFETGPLLMRVAQTCEEAGATLLVLHHTPKPSARKLEPLELTDLAFSGIAEFARQWILLSRREAYEPGSGSHKLWMVVGGSVGHGGLYGVDIFEGPIGDDFTGRKWEVTVAPGTAIRTEEKDGKVRARAEERAARDQVDDTTVEAALNQLGRNGEPVPFARVQHLCGLSPARTGGACERLIAAGAAKWCEVTVTVGNGAERPAKGLRKVTDNADQTGA
jgi:replicative DNA helicase